MAKKPKTRHPQPAPDLQAETRAADIDKAKTYGTNPDGEFPQFDDEFPDLADTFPSTGNDVILEISLEELEAEEEQGRRTRELATDGPIDTQHTDGSAYYGDQADEQGLVYIPPDDPPILPSDDVQGVRIAAGWSQGLDPEDDIRDEDLPARFSRNDADVQEKIYILLANSGETSDLTDIQIDVQEGVVYLYGRVPTLLDADLVENLIREIDGVIDVEERLEVAALV